jgi:IS30 family transposase
MTYSQLDRDDRVKLAALLRAGHSLRGCARVIGVSPATVSRELARHGGIEEYTVWRAQRQTKEMRISANDRFNKIEHQGWLVSCIVRNLKKYRSPEQIAGVLKRKQGKTVICHETIYTWIYATRPDLKKYLRQRKGKYRRRGGTTARAKVRESGKKRRINERPMIVERRTRIGDWEGDTILSSGSLHRILTFVERKSGYLMAVLIENGSGDLVKKKSIEAFKRIPKSKRSESCSQRIE